MHDGEDRVRVVGRQLDIADHPLTARPALLERKERVRSEEQEGGNQRKKEGQML